MHSTGAAAAATLTASDLRNTLNRLLGEHAVLAMNATNLGVTGSKSFPAAAKALDRNSVALSQAIGSIYGAKAAKTFPRRPFPVAGARQVLRRLYGGAREEGHEQPEQGGREPQDLHGEAR